MEAAACALFHARDEDDECAACSTFLLHLESCNQSMQQLAVLPPSVVAESSASSRVFSCMLDELVLYVVLRSFAKPPMNVVDVVKSGLESLDGYAHWNVQNAVSDQLSANVIQLRTKLLEAAWTADALNSLSRVLALLEEPQVRQASLRFAFDVVRMTLATLPPVTRVSKVPLLDSSNSSIIVRCQRYADVLLLGLTDVWSAIRSECTRHAAVLVLALPTLDAIDSFVDRLLCVAAGTEYIGRDKTVATLWTERDGALATLAHMLDAISVETGNESQVSRTTDASVVQVIRGTFAKQETAAKQFRLSARHPNVAQLPRALTQSLKPVLYECLRHDQVAVRTHAAQCLAHFAALADDTTQLLVFQEVVSKLNRLKASDGGDDTDDDHLLGAFEADGLLDVLAKIAPLLPPPFLLKHWAFVFPTLERYVVHIASSVRQRSSAVVLALARLAQTASASTTSSTDSIDAAASLELLVAMMLSLSDAAASASASDDVCWQRAEGRLLSIDALVHVLGTDLLARRYGTTLLHSPDEDGGNSDRLDAVDGQFWALADPAAATWTLDDTDVATLALLAARTQPFATVDARTSRCLVDALDRFLSESSQQRDDTVDAHNTWHRVLSGWCRQTQRAFASHQFELRRIAQQVLPGLVRLCAWTHQLICALDNHGGATTRWPSVKAALLHVQFLSQSVAAKHVRDDSIKDELRAVATAVTTFVWRSLDDTAATSTSCTNEHDSEAVTKAEALAIAFLSGSALADRRAYALQLLARSFAVVNRHLPLLMQLSSGSSGASRNGASLDRQLSVALVRLLPAIATALAAAAPDTTDDDAVVVATCWRVLMRAALAWLAADDMLRWITVRMSDAHASLLRALLTLTQCAVVCSDDIESERALLLTQLDAIVLRQRHIATESTLSYAVAICAVAWRNAPAAGAAARQCCASIVSAYAQLAAQSVVADIDVIAATSWDDWDADDVPSTSGSASELPAAGVAPLATAVADRAVAAAVSTWRAHELVALRDCISLHGPSSSSSMMQDNTACARELVVALLDRIIASLSFTFAPAPHDDSVDVDAHSHRPVDATDSRAKRQRVARSDTEIDDAATQQTPRRVVHVHMVERICTLQDTASLDATMHYGLFIWPSAMVLAHFVARHWATVVRNKVVLELGCGTGLPGILAAVGGEPKAVLLTDRSDAIDIERNVAANIALNGISGTTQFVALDWGQTIVDDAAQVALFETVDVLLAADCFYDPKHFETALATAALIFRCSPRCRLYTTYQLRSVAYTIAPLLTRWNMRATRLDTTELLPHDDDGDNDNDDATCSTSFANVCLYEIAPIWTT